MTATKIKKLAITLGLAASSLAATIPAAQASAAPAVKATSSSNYSLGEALLVIYNDSPLRVCPGTNCAVILNMPASAGFFPGGGWVTSEANQNASGAWCVINYRNHIGWTGCWRLSDASEFGL